MRFAGVLAAGLVMASALSSDAVIAAADFTPNDMPTGWVGEVDVTSFDFSDGNQTIFKGDYIKGEWSGNLLAFPVDAQGTVLFGAERWSGGAVENLDGQNYDTGRVIVTMKADGTRIPFRWASLDSSQRSPLGDNTKGPMVLNYIRGDRSNENPSGQKYRARARVLGDIIHSRPVFVAHPTDPRVYVGANDGMLHAFDATDGTEVFAYVPSFFISPTSANFSHVKALTADPYVHQHFVDGTPNVQTVTISGATKKILVGGVGAGGKGLYALDVTDPIAGSESAAAGKILWEITPTTINNANSSSYADLGHTYGYPVIAKLSDGTWAALIGNGYNNDGGNQAVLYVINLMTGAKIAGIQTSVSGTSDANANGLSSPTAVDVDRDGKVDYVYAGDINGNLWKFDLRNMASPTVTKLFTTSPTRAITGRPVVSLHPNGGYMINFATGRMFTAADATDAATVHYAYGLWDNGTTIDSANLVGQTLTAKTWSGAGGFNYNVRVSSSNAVEYTGTAPKQGWKLALPAGERVVGDGGLVTNNRYVFSSTNPTVTHAPVNGVAQPQGDNWLNEVDFTTGGGGSSPIFDLDANLMLNDDDRVRASSGSGAQAGPTGVPVSRYITAGVMSQPIVARLETLSETYFNTNPDYFTSTSSSSDVGISQGHFDFDIYYNVCTASTANKYSCPKRTHVHEYDDKYDVTGVDMQNASLPAFNVSNAIPATTTRFKILMANQAASPAAKVQIGTTTGDSWIPVYDYLTPTASSPPPALGTGNVLGTNTPFSSWLPVYQRSNLVNLRIALPLNAFAQLDWQHGQAACTPGAANPSCIVGVIPTQTGCVHDNQTGLDSSTAADGKPYGGLWMNGALTIQLIKEGTPDAYITMHNASYPALGYRLKSDAASQSYQLAQYTLFWHHPNKKCYGTSGWKNTTTGPTDGAYPDLSPPGSTSAKAPGSTDPADGQFGGNGSVSGGGGTGSGGVSGPTSTVTYTFSDGSSVTQTMTKNADGSVTVTRVYSYGGTESFTIPPSAGGKQADVRAKTGRVSWREMQRP